MEKEFVLSALGEGLMQLEGRFVYGSNYTFMVTCIYQSQTFKAVYKPLQGEQPLWDFPAQTLAHREVAAYLVSEALGWRLVPSTVFRRSETPLGPGSVQLIIQHDPDCHYFTFSEEEKRNLPQVMLFDLLINNADRKAGHLLIDPSGSLKLIDHGLCFHVEAKLRTVVWDHAGDPIPHNLSADIERIMPLFSAGGSVFEALKDHLSGDEIKAVQRRGQVLLKAGVFPHPPEDRRAYPLPLV